MSRAEEILREKCRWTQTEIDAERYYELAEVMESYAREEREFVDRYRRYHDGVALCESAETVAECGCTICCDVRAARIREGGEE